MNNIKDNPPPLPEPDMEVTAGRTTRIHSVLKIRQIEAAAFERCKAVMQREIDDWKSSHADACRRFERAEQTLREVRQECDELRAKLKALEEQKPVALWNFEKGFDNCQVDKLNEAAKKAPAVLYLAAGAKQ